MSVHTSGAGGGVSVSGNADRLVRWDGSSLLAVDAYRADGTNIALGGAIISGRRLTLYQESSGVGVQVVGFAASQAGEAVVASSDSRLLINRMWGGTAVGTINGLNAAALAHILPFNTAHLLVGATDARTWVAVRTNAAAALGGTLKTFQADVSHDGTGTDVFYSYAVPGAALTLDGDRVDFDFTIAFAATGGNKQPIVAWGATTLYAPTTAAKNGGSIRIFGSIWRTGAATQRWVVTAVDDASTTRFPTVTAYGTAAETLSGSVNLELRGAAGVAADMVAKLGAVYHNAAGN
jgi:hypothetical protein